MEGGGGDRIGSGGSDFEGGGGGGGWIRSRCQVGGRVNMGEQRGREGED